MKGRRAAFVLAAAVAAGTFAAGLFREEFRDTLVNAALICLSCIGIG